MTPQVCMGFRPEANWNDYVFEWTPDYIQFFINGNMVRKIDKNWFVDFQTDKQKVFLNFWSSTTQGWGDNFNDWDMPWYSKFDYVKVETYNYTTGGFDFHWEDKFDSFDYSRWNVSDGI